MLRFKSGSSIKRMVNLPSVGSSVSVEIDGAGVSFWVPGSRARIYASWDNIATHSRTSETVPSFLMDRPLDLLRYYAAKLKK